MYGQPPCPPALGGSPLAIENSSKPGDAVLDLFLGSGTTLIAAERTSRVCRAVELDPRYVDVDVAAMRWEAFTGQQARKEARP